jgi:ABC-type nitrate/sulfonate/bicarbonate transport system permease component
MTWRGGNALRHRVMLPIIGVAIVLAAWEATVVGYALPVVVLPSPLAVARTLVELLGTRAFWHDVGISLFEFGTGYAIGMILGIGGGLAIAESRSVRLVVSPVIEGLRFVVPFAWIPLTILWFGTSFVGKIALVAYAVFFVMIVSTARAVANVDHTLTRVGSAARAAAAIGWIAVVAAEYIGASAGLGLMITNAASSLATAVVIAGMIVIGLVGAGVSALVRWLALSRLDYQ